MPLLGLQRPAEVMLNINLQNSLMSMLAKQKSVSLVMALHLTVVWCLIGTPKTNILTKLGGCKQRDIVAQLVR